MKTYDAIVIGGGPGGYPCSIKLGQLGLKVVCVEKEKPGGVCLNWGCIPSKALIQAANTYERTKDGAAIGVKVSGIELDPNAMQDWKEGIVKKLNDGVRGLLKGNGADYLEGTAKLVSKDTVEVTLKDGGRSRSPPSSSTASRSSAPRRRSTCAQSRSACSSSAAA